MAPVLVKGFNDLKFSEQAEKEKAGNEVTLFLPFALSLKAQFCLFVRRAT